MDNINQKFTAWDSWDLLQKDYENINEFNALMKK